MSKTLKAQDGETKLERAARLWMNDKGRDYEDGWRGAYKDLEYGGCSSGMVGGLIYYTDTVKFYRKYQPEISAFLTEDIESMGVGIGEMFGERWDASDPLALEDNNRNLLAWYGFETAARRVAEANGYEG